MFMFFYSMYKVVLLPQLFASQREFIVTLPPQLATFLVTKLMWDLLQATFYLIFAIITPLSVFSFFFSKTQL